MMKRQNKNLATSLQALGGKHQQRAIELDIHAGRSETLQTFKALASEPRLRILEYLTYPASRLSNLTEIAGVLEMNLATVTMHVNILEDAGLILCEHVPGERGTQRVCGCFVNWINLHMTPKLPSDVGHVLEQSIPLGAFSNFEVTPTCGLFSAEKHIGSYDDPLSFYEAERVQAQLLWFHSGFVEYVVPLRLPTHADIESLSLSMELCSEAPTYHEDWPSDISVWINDVDLGHWTSPADFGGVRGKLTPAWQPTHATQYGLLKTWQVTHKDSQVDGHKVSNVTLNNLNLTEAPLIKLRIGVKETAEHVGGVNLLGASFGNHPQDIILSIRYHQQD